MNGHRRWFGLALALVVATTGSGCTASKVHEYSGSIRDVFGTNEVRRTSARLYFDYAVDLPDGGTLFVFPIDAPKKYAPNSPIVSMVVGMMVASGDEEPHVIGMWAVPNSVVSAALSGSASWPEVIRAFWNDFVEQGAAGRPEGVIELQGETHLGRLDPADYRIRVELVAANAPQAGAVLSGEFRVRTEYHEALLSGLLAPVVLMSK